MLVSQDSETIIAQCTPTGAGALAVLRLSGDDAVSIAARMSILQSHKKLNEVLSHTIHYGAVVDNHGAIIDRVLFFVMHAPKTFTGQHVVEISCHNNPFIIQGIIDQTIVHGARLAQEGEFTRRALLNGKIDLIQAEAINDLFHAHTKAALQKSLAQLEGNLSHAIHGIEQDLLKSIALCEASFEFIDEDMTFDEPICQLIDGVMNSIVHIKKNFDQQQRIKEGVRVAIIGSVNAGKSSLFNALLGKQRAIVTHIAGTTRDVIEAGVYRSQHYMTLIDTAGIRQTADIIEQEGINRSFEQAMLADVILLVLDTSLMMSIQEYDVYNKLFDQYRNKIIVVGNKADAMMRTKVHVLKPEIFVSSKTGFNIPALEKLIETKIGQLFAQADAPFLLNKRQFNLLQSIENKLELIKELFFAEGKRVAHELLSAHLNEALACLSELSGKDVSEKAMDAIFKEFCVGK